MAGLDNAWEQVFEFHRAFDVPVAERPCGISKERAATRCSWMQDEIAEFLEASLRDDLTEQADAMIDLIYFALGTLVEMGVHPQPIMDIVHRANMSKLWPDGKPRFRNGDNKVVKPKGWSDPHDSIKAELDRQIESGG